MQPFVLLVKAMADETRIRIILALHHSELCVCQLTTFLNLAPSTVSKHISLLLQAGLVSKRKCGKWAYYSLAIENTTSEVKTAHSFICNALADNPIAKKDLLYLQKVLSTPLEEVCQKYKTQKDGGITE
ncbi:MAG: winged helix-turn-helix transcriptional regulator [Candidatus Riflebacteria bacterium]|nr:winged helix-turn-helix transcriptional regulator [Candidatus Riflebacteria bacterium]